MLTWSHVVGSVVDGSDRRDLHDLERGQVVEREGHRRALVWDDVDVALCGEVGELEGAEQGRPRVLPRHGPPVVPHPRVPEVRAPHVDGPLEAVIVADHAEKIGVGRGERGVGRPVAKPAVPVLERVVARPVGGLEVDARAVGLDADELLGRRGDERLVLVGLGRLRHELQHRRDLPQRPIIEVEADGGEELLRLPLVLVEKVGWNRSVVADNDILCLMVVVGLEVLGDVREVVIRNKEGLWKTRRRGVVLEEGIEVGVASEPAGQS